MSLARSDTKREAVAFALTVSELVCNKSSHDAQQEWEIAMLAEHSCSSQLFMGSLQLRAVPP